MFVNEATTGDEAMPLPARLRAAREASGLSRREVELKTGFSGRTIEKLENGQQDLSMPRAVRLCAVYGLDPAELLREAQADAGLTAGPSPQPADPASAELAAVRAQLARLESALSGRDESRTDAPGGASIDPAELLDELAELVERAPNHRRQPTLTRAALGALVELADGDPDAFVDLAEGRGVELPGDDDPMEARDEAALLVADALTGLGDLSLAELNGLLERVAEAAEDDADEAPSRREGFFGLGKVETEEAWRLRASRWASPRLVALAAKRRLPSLEALDTRSQDDELF